MEESKSIKNIAGNGNYMEKLLQDIKRRENTKKVRRIKSAPVDDISNALKAVYAIGKTKKETFKIDNDNKWVFAQLTKWIQADPSFMAHDARSTSDLKEIKGDLTKGIYLAGPTGTGKTWALDIISYFSKIDNIEVICGGILTDMEYKSVRTDSICASFANGNSIEKYKAIPIICFHDLASPTEPEESMYMGNRIKIMQSIIEARGDRQDLITLFTSNIPFTSPLFFQRYGERAVSRLHEMCNYLQLEGSDRRVI